MATCILSPSYCLSRATSSSAFARFSFSSRISSSFPSIALSSSAASKSSGLFTVRCSFNDRVKWSDDGERMIETEQQEQEELKFRQPDEGKVPQRLYESRGLTRDGPTKGGHWLSSTTRHVRLYIGYIDPVTFHMDRLQTDKITLILDPDNEFIWPEDKCQKVYNYLMELLDNYAGAPCTEYTLRLIGSDIEHYIRKLLLDGEIKYNLDCRVLNFSMGRPRLNPEQLPQQA